MACALGIVADSDKSLKFLANCKYVLRFIKAWEACWRPDPDSVDEEMTCSYKKFFAAVGVAFLLAGCASGNTVAEKRTSILKMRSETLTTLYSIEPGSRERIEKSAGHAVFSNVGINVILLSAGGGWGVAHNNATDENTYLNMGSAGFGFGLGVKDFRGVFVFTDSAALEWFIEEGWDGSAQADVAAKAGSKGDAWAGAVDVAPGIKLYQITENGLALQATIQGTKYWKDSELN